MLGTSWEAALEQHWHCWARGLESPLGAGGSRLETGLRDVALEIELPEVKTKPMLIFIFARGDLFYLYAILTERDACVQTACSCPHGEGFCPWSQAVAMYKLFWHSPQPKEVSTCRVRIMRTWRGWRWAHEEAPANRSAGCEESFSPMDSVCTLPSSSLSFVPTVSVCLLSHQFFCLWPGS